MALHKETTEQPVATDMFRTPNTQNSPILKDDSLNVIASDSNLRVPEDAWEPVLHNG